MGIGDAKGFWTWLGLELQHPLLVEAAFWLQIAVVDKTLPPWDWFRGMTLDSMMPIAMAATSRSLSIGRSIDFDRSADLVERCMQYFSHFHYSFYSFLFFYVFFIRWFACQYSPIVLRQSPTPKSVDDDKLWSDLPVRSWSSSSDACNSTVRFSRLVPVFVREEMKDRRTNCIPRQTTDATRG